MGQITLGLPIPGQPDSSEEPKIPSDFTILQTLLNGGLDRTNLAPGVGTLLLTEQNATYAAANGDMVLIGQSITPPFNVTAPVPGIGVKFGVKAGFRATGAAPILVAPHGSELFVGQGYMAGAAGVFLGAPGASVVFESDGTNWIEIAGQQDTGWKPLTLPANWTVTSGFYTPAMRLIGDRVWLRGSATNGTGGVGQLTSALATILYPGATVTMTGSATGGGVGYVTVFAAGNLVTAAVSAGGIIVLDGLSYSLL